MTIEAYPYPSPCDGATVAQVRCPRCTNVFERPATGGVQCPSCGYPRAPAAGGFAAPQQTGYAQLGPGHGSIPGYAAALTGLLLIAAAMVTAAGESWFAFATDDGTDLPDLEVLGYILSAVTFAGLSALTAASHLRGGQKRTLAIVATSLFVVAFITARILDSKIDDVSTLGELKGLMWIGIIHDVAVAASVTLGIWLVSRVLEGTLSLLAIGANIALGVMMVLQFEDAVNDGPDALVSWVRLAGWYSLIVPGLLGAAAIIAAVRLKSYFAGGGATSSPPATRAGPARASPAPVRYPPAPAYPARPTVAIRPAAPTPARSGQTPLARPGATPLARAPARK